MRVILQRVKEARVTVNGEVTGKIGKGILVFLGIHKQDQPSQTSWLVQKLVNLRFFPDENGKMNIGVKDIQGDILVVSQFTLYGNCLEGRRPDFTESAPPEIAESIYNKFVDEVRIEMGRVETGVFGAKMEVSLVNDGPVTFIIEDSYTR